MNETSICSQKGSGLKVHSSQKRAERGRGEIGYSNGRNARAGRGQAMKNSRARETSRKERREAAVPADGNRRTSIRSEKHPQNFEKHGNSVSLNHLLNFSFPARPPVNTPNHSQRSKKFPLFKKERYVQANFHFVLNPSAHPSLSDPDLVLNWDEVEQVYLATTSPQTCPICLEPPVAGKITKCGHVFCWSCMIRYLSLGQKLWRRCPICFEAVHLNHLKSVVIEDKTCMKEGENISFALLQRAKESTVAIPRKRWTLQKSNNYMDSSDIDRMFVRFTRTTNTRGIIDREALELTNAIKEAASAQEDSLPYLLEAQSLLEKRDIPTRVSTEFVEFVKPKASLPPPPSYSSEYNNKATLAYQHFAREEGLLGFEEDTEEEETDASSVWSEDEEDSQGFLITNPPASMDKSENCGKESEKSKKQESKQESKQEHSPSGKEKQNLIATPFRANHPEERQPQVQSFFYFFYQESSGQLYFLHPLNIKMMFEQFGSYENFPDTLSGKILSLDEMTVTEQTRKRYKFLQHLPLSCSLLWCEIDLEGIVSRHVLEKFNGELSKRKTQRLMAQVDDSNGSRSESLYKELLNSSESIEGEFALTQSAPFLSSTTNTSTNTTSTSSTTPATSSTSTSSQSSTPKFSTTSTTTSDTNNVSHSPPTPTFVDALKSKSKPKPLQGLTPVVVPHKKNKQQKTLLLLSNSAQRRY